MDNSNLQELERLRKKVLYYDVLAIVPIIAGIVLAFATRKFLLIMIGFVVTIVMLICGSKLLKNYKKYYKDVFIKSVIQQAFPGATYEPEQGFQKSMISETGLMMMGNIYHSEDYIRGVCNDVEFERADMLIQDESTDSDGNTYTTNYLRGRWMIFESNKTFVADLQIIQKGFGYAKKKKGFFTRKTERRHELKTEDEQFNRMFQCMCQDDAEAFYLLTPGVMQSLMQLAQTMDGKVMVGFVDNRIHVAVNSNKDSLEPPVMHAVSDKEVAEVQNEIRAVTSFIAGLKLERKIFQ